MGKPCKVIRASAKALPGQLQRGTAELEILQGALRLVQAVDQLHAAAAAMCFSNHSRELVNENTSRASDWGKRVVRFRCCCLLFPHASVLTLTS